MRLNHCALLPVLLALSAVYLGGRLTKALSSFGLLLATLVFSISAGAVTIPTVLVGNPGNPADTNGVGSVGYNFRIATTEVTNAQYVQFLNGVDPSGSNTLTLYNTFMTSAAPGGINFNSGAANGSKYSVKTGRDNNPVVLVTWYDSIRFANWLHNGQGSGDTETGSYALGPLGADGVPLNGSGITRNAGARWFLPTENEWYKAAYHKNDGLTGNYWEYPTSTNAVPYSDQPPGTNAPDPSNTANYFKNDSIADGYDDGYAVTGSTSFNNARSYLTDVGAYTFSTSPYGTFDQGGNVSEWNEALSSGSFRNFRGGAWNSRDNGFFLELSASVTTSTDPTAGNNDSSFGFRVASIPDLPGDFNNDGAVDSADYVLWRKNQGTDEEYNTWRANFGFSLGPGSGSVLPSAEPLSAAVPEPSSLALLTLAAPALLRRRHHSRDDF